MHTVDAQRTTCVRVHVAAKKAKQAYRVGVGSVGWSTLEQRPGCLVGKRHGDHQHVVRWQPPKQPIALQSDVMGVMLFTKTIKTRRCDVVHKNNQNAPQCGSASEKVQGDGQVAGMEQVVVHCTQRKHCHQHPIQCVPVCCTVLHALWVQVQQVTFKPAPCSKHMQQTSVNGTQCIAHR